MTTMPETRTVRIIIRNGWHMHIESVTVDWFCPVCGGPRGEPRGHNFHEDGEWFFCHQWVNPCGHVDLYPQVAEEAKANADSQSVLAEQESNYLQGLKAR